MLSISTSDQKKVSPDNKSLLVTRVSRFIAIMGIPYTVLFLVLGLPIAAAHMTLLFGMTIISIWLTSQKHINTAKYLLITNVSSMLLIYSLLLGKEAGAPLIFFQVIALPLILFSHHEKLNILLGSLIPVTGCFFYEYTKLVGRPNFLLNFHEPISIVSQTILFEFAIITAFLFTFYFVYFYFLSNYESEKQLIIKNKELEFALEQLQQKKKQDAELAIAKDISLKLIQKDWPRKGPVIMDYVYHPATHASGDYLMTKQFSDNEHAILIADVAGHGLPACLMMTSLKSLISTIIYRGRTPGEMLNMLNSLVYHSDEITKQAPVLCGMINIDKMTFTYANGGHQEGYVFSPTTDKFKKLKSGGLPIGLSHNAKYEEHTISLHPNDVIIFFTDGLNEGKNPRGTPFGIPKLKAKIRKHLAHAHHSKLATKLHRSFTHFNENQPTKDDITILTAWVKT